MVCALRLPILGWLVILSIVGQAAAIPSGATAKSVLVSGTIARLSPHYEGEQISLPEYESSSPSGRTEVHCLRIDLQPHKWSWKELVWGTMEALISVVRVDQEDNQESDSERAAGSEGAELAGQAATEKALQLQPLDLQERDWKQSATRESTFFVALVSLRECTPGAAVNATVICKGGDSAPCHISIVWSQRSCICTGKLPHTSKTLENPLEFVPLKQPPGSASSPKQPSQSPASQMPAAQHSPETPPLVLHAKASIRVPQLSMLLTICGLVLLSSAEPLSRVSACHVMLGGMLGAGLAHVGVMLAIAAVPGAVVALPWVAALSAYRLGICEALAMLVAGYVYTVAMALALLYLYTQHFSYVQAVYLFVVFHAALAGALRAETGRENVTAEAPSLPPPSPAILGGGAMPPPEQNWVTVWVPGRGVVLQRTVYFALLACGGALFAGTTNIWLHAAILRAHSSHDLPLWLALSVSAAPVFVLVGLEIHCKLLSRIVGTLVSLPRGVLEEGVDLVRFVRQRLGYYVPGQARGGGGRYDLRPVRRVFYAHVLSDEAPGVKTGPERDLWLIRNALRRVGYWMAGVKPPIAGSEVYRGGNWAGRSIRGALDNADDGMSGDVSRDPTWSPSFEGSAAVDSVAVAADSEDDEQEVSSTLRELPRGSSGYVDLNSGSVNRGALRGSSSEGAPFSNTEPSKRSVSGLLWSRRDLRTSPEARRFVLWGRRTETDMRSAGDSGQEGGTLGLEAWERGAESEGANLSNVISCRDDRDYYENVSEDEEETACSPGAVEEWDWLAAEGLTPGEALAGQSCPVCLSLRKNLAFGCGHQTCQGCGAGLAKCPICRKRISVRVPLFH